MRKVTREIVEAFLQGKPLSRGNTATDGIRIQLHGNTIAMRNAMGKILISDAGWRTRTTQDRLNGLLYIMHMQGMSPKMRSVSFRRGSSDLTSSDWEIIN